MCYRAELGILLKGKLFWILLAGSVAVNLWILANFLTQVPLVELSARLSAEGKTFENAYQTEASADMFSLSKTTDWIPAETDSGRNYAIWISTKAGDEDKRKSQKPTKTFKGYRYVTEENYEILIQLLEAAEPRNAQVSVRSLIEGALRLSQTLSTDDLAETYIHERRLTGAAAEKARKAYRTLEPYILRDREEGTANALFVPGTNRFFELFSRYLPLACMAESVLAGALLTLLCVNAPYDSGMKEVVYTTKTGRRLNCIKLMAAFSVSALFSVAVWGASLGLTAALLPMGNFLIQNLSMGSFPLGSLWDVKIGSMMMLDDFCPLICRLSVSLRTYLLLQAVLSTCVVLLFSTVACLFVEGSHRTIAAFFELAFVCATIAVFTQLFPQDSKLLFLARFNPVDFALKAGRYFASGGTFLSVRYYETTLVIFWGTLLAAGLLWQNHRLRKEDI